MMRKLFLAGAVTAILLGLAMLVANVPAVGAAEAEVHKAEAATGAVAEQIARGEGLYKTHCSGCHQANGQGLTGAFPPLAGSDYLLADRQRAIATVLQGRSGPIAVNGKDYNAVMPGMGYLSDQEVADIVTFALNSWGNEGGPVTAEEVGTVRGGVGPGDRATGERHPGAPEGEMRYQGAPSAIAAEEARPVVTPEGPQLTAEEYEIATRLFFERCAGCQGR